jgi:dethiobiotin synthetase
MLNKIFITGTDTNIGKTYISVGLLKLFSQLGFSTLGIKPLSSGCIAGKNEDVIALRNASTVKLPYSSINPFVFEPPIAPNIAAKKIDLTLSVLNISAQLNETLQYPVDMKIIEGVGGWNVPLNDSETLADLIKHFNISVVLVVGMKLGCLNHAILTFNAIRQVNVAIIGWVANCIDPQMQEVSANIETLKMWLKCPFLGTVPYRGNPEQFLDLEILLRRGNNRSIP